MTQALATHGARSSKWLKALVSDGIARVPHVLTSAEISALIRALDAVPVSDSLRQKDGTYAIRNLFDVVPKIGELAECQKVRRIVEAVLGVNAVPVRGILFDKTPSANWKVPMHQDLTIAVRNRLEIPGFGPWTVKSGVVHVQPPVTVLEQMLSVRLHLDDCGELNAPLRVIRGTHLAGRLATPAIERLRQERKITECVAGAGDALVMRPLLLHSSSPSRSPEHRRVIHIDFAAGALPCGLDWAAGGNNSA